MIVCERGHEFPIDKHSGLPSLFDPERPQPMHATFYDPLGKEPDDYPALGEGEIDAFVQSQIQGTGGWLYDHTRLTQYPAPRFPIAPPSVGGTVLDVGSGWGRWAMSAARAGNFVIAVDPWIDSCRAHVRVSTQLGLRDQLEIVHGDGRRLPLPDDCVDVAFSYSVIQHLPKTEAYATVAEMTRVTRPGGSVLIQMPNVAGIRQRQQVKRGAVSDDAFNVRPWTLNELRELAMANSAKWKVEIDGFFSLNAQWSERAAMPLRSRAIVAASETVKLFARAMPWLVNVADSVWIRLDVK